MKTGAFHLGTLPFVHAATACVLNAGKVSVKLQVTFNGAVMRFPNFGLVLSVVMVTLPQFELMMYGIAGTGTGPVTTLTTFITLPGTHFQLLVTVNVCVAPLAITLAAGE